MGIFNFFTKKANKNMFKALAIGDMDLLIKALKDGANINAKDEEGLSPLHYASYIGYPPDVFELFINLGADANVKDETSELTPLMISSAVSPYTKVIEILCENYADIEAKDMAGNTPLLWAIDDVSFYIRYKYTYHAPVYKIVKELIEWDADVNACNNSLVNVYDKIYRIYKKGEYAQSKYVYKYLCEKGTAPDLKLESYLAKSIFDQQLNKQFSKGLLLVTRLSRLKAKHNI